MYTDDTDCWSCSDCKLEFIENGWTDLLLNWLNKCVHPKAPTKELNPWSMVEVFKKYRQDIRADEIEGAILFSDVEAFVRYKYPLLRLRYYDLKEEQKKMYLLASIILFHCCVSSVTGTVDGEICGNLNKYEQELILKFCEKQMEMEVTCNNLELAIKEAFDSVKQDPRTYRKIDHNHIPSKMKSEPSESCYSTAEMPLSSFNSLAAPSTEGMKQKCNDLKFKSAESESFEPCSTSDMPLSSLNSMATDILAPVEKNNATFQSLEFESFERGELPELTPFLPAGKSPTGSMKKKITATFKSVEYESYVPASSTDRPSHISKALCKSPTGSLKQKINATIKTIEYESYIPCPAPDKSAYNSKGLEKLPTGTKKQALNAKSRAKDESYESCSLTETPSYNLKCLDKSPTESLEQRLNTKSKAKAKYKSYESYSSRDRSPCNSKAVDETPTESRKNKNHKSKAAKHKPQPDARPVTVPVISIMTSGKSPAEQKFNSLKFKSSVTVLPSVLTTDASYSEVDYLMDYGSKSDTEEKSSYIANSKGKLNVAHYVKIMPTAESGSERRCLSNCACSRCSPNGPCCEESGNSIFGGNTDDGTAMNSSSDVYHVETVREPEKPNEEKRKHIPSKRFLFSKTFMIFLTILVTIAIMIIFLVLLFKSGSSPLAGLFADDKVERLSANPIHEARIFQLNSYICKQGFCQKVYEPTSEYIYSSLSRCILLCMGPQLWPHPIGYTYFSKKVVVLATNKLEYKLQSVPSEAVHMYLAEAFKLFLGDLAKLERYTLDARRMNISRDSMIKKMYIQMDVETDPDPRIRLDTEESYTIKVETINNQVVIKLLSASFCGIRHALETLSQLILLDQTTGNLITLSNMIIKDAPSYKYRGLMIDTGRNFIPVPDIMRTIDAMASVKLNTFHWRISDVTSFPLHLPAVPQLFEYGSYGRELVYSKDDVKAVVRRAGIRGIRILLEVAAPGPVGRAWSWIPEATCPTKNKNFTCNNILCLRLGIQETVFDILQIIYSEILEMTKVDDVFHLSDGVFSMVNCYYLMEEREGFLDKALERLKLANKGFLPKLPIIWYTTHLTKDLEARTWDRFGVQLSEWQPNPSDQFLSRFKVIHSSRWDLSCEVKKQRCRKYRTWQDMYSWKSWRNLEVFTIEGGEAILWTDLVDTGNLDYHLWPRAAAVAERLWSDIALNGTVSNHVYVRLDNQRWRMVLKSVQVQPIWPLYCSFSPGVCLEKIVKYK